MNKQFAARVGHRRKCAEREASRTRTKVAPHSGVELVSDGLRHGTALILTAPPNCPSQARRSRSNPATRGIRFYPTACAHHFWISARDSHSECLIKSSLERWFVRGRLPAITRRGGAQPAMEPALFRERQDAMILQTCRSLNIGEQVWFCSATGASALVPTTFLITATSTFRSCTDPSKTTCGIVGVADDPSQPTITHAGSRRLDQSASLRMPNCGQLKHWSTLTGVQRQT